MMDQLVETIAKAVADTLPTDAKRRASALIIARSAMPDADVYDRIRLARYIDTGNEDPPPTIEMRSADGQVRHFPTQSYPHPSGDVTALGPGVIASTEDPTPETVISWRGQNFTAVLHDEPLIGVVGPDPEFGKLVQESQDAQTAPPPTPEDEEEAVPDFQTEPAPSAGRFWAGRRGSQS